VKKKHPLAHSRRGDIPAQTYVEHVTNVCCVAEENARNAIAHYKGDREAFVDWVKAAALYHDLGKLDEANQAVLRQESREPLPIAHDDAGVAELDRLGRQEAAILACGHHEGLFSRREELAKQGRPFRQLKRTTPEGEKVADHVDRRLKDYNRIHSEAGCALLTRLEPVGLHGCGFTRRIALSCLVDADHGDTARHHEKEVESVMVEPRWEDRLAALQRYVERLPKGKTKREQYRNGLRKRVFETCHNAPVAPPIRTCDAPVGSGKTTAVMAHLLRVAAKRNPQLRHIIVVLPYTNIITQAVEIYRKALVLNGERPEDIVAEHHHRADFDELGLRQLATLWKAPIVVTTAVQFFETLGSNHPGRLRKLHELPGSAVFVDEMHGAIPSHLWPQMWRWLKTWTEDWGGHLVLGSGSLPRFWDLAEYKNLICGPDDKPLPEVPDLIADDSLRSKLKRVEERRIHYQRRPEASEALDCRCLIDFIVSECPGPQLLIVNTVQTAAVIARAMREAGHDVLHLSTALAPVHRDIIIERIRLRLREKIPNWTLVATSCVESGMDFSFRTGIRERASVASLIQIGGRVSRGDEFKDVKVWDILVRDDRFRTNPVFTVARQALDRFSLEELNKLEPSDLATLAMRREWTSGAEGKARTLVKDEEEMEYPSVSRQCRVIDTDARMVVIDTSLVNAMKKGEKVSKTELMRYSVQLWARKIDKLRLEPICSNGCCSRSDIYRWPYEYDPDFLGYMKGLLKLEEFITSGGAVI